ncbi:MAG: CoA-binding protein [Candidatus Marinimicrobia bacterium]|nr:CoA-binding protein [Candidatus Neomarinimicrobiota bacterium]MBT4359466.1 CoA-binding protein [Candidatus Neomarinimicrobiota bacterium]MBT4715996.1 CoA-binding protein [Candidatus Neomarinimicrobiota bacterium]MBT4948071.1 CoA-binding protein [Candidatus Neomarinimicrobiota bacterium]MBT5270953.1 CoA-binding protein [Candidatus Neomarinimicrobiota bacterium]
MVNQNIVESFLTEKKLALAGASRTAGKFGNAVFKELSSQGYELFLIHPEAEAISGVTSYRSLSELPTVVGGLITVIPPAQTKKLVQEAHAVGIKKVWMQQGSASEDAIGFCQEHDMDVVHGECILMFAQPQGLHKFHHWLWGLFGKLPKGHHN